MVAIQEDEQNVVTQPISIKKYEFHWDVVENRNLKYSSDISLTPYCDV